MKKIIAIILMAVVVLSGCNNSSSQSGNAKASDESYNLNQNEYPNTEFMLLDNNIINTKAIPNSKNSGFPSTDKKSIDMPVRAIWISYLEYDSILKGKTEEQFTENVKLMYDKLIDAKINTVIIHARAHGDAYYESKAFPWAKRVTGTVNVKPSFDPFKIMTDLANSMDLSVHAWINPYRLMEDADMKKLPSTYKIKKWYDSANRSDYMIKISGIWWMNPANVECRKLVYTGVREIVNGYDVDAIHIDDYFYYTTLDKYKQTYKQAQSAVNTTIKGIYKAIKEIDNDVLFGVSPQGSISENLLPNSDLSTSQCSDVKKWVTTPGYIDYIMPQVYFGFNNQSSPFYQTVNRWQALVNPRHCKLMIALSPYKSGTEDKWAGNGKNEWKNNTNIIARQVEYLNTQLLVDGYVLFRYDSVFSDSLTGNAKKESENLLKVLKNK